MASATTVVDYDPRWPLIFDQLRASIQTALGDLAIAVEHVGSTAVPGLAAKPIIDIDAVVDADSLREAICRLGAAGYVHEGDLGIQEREAFVAPAGSPPHHLYVVAPDSLELERHLAFRDRLRAEPRVAREYGDLKRRLAATTGDRSEYTAGKAGFIQALLIPRDRG